MNTIKLQLKFPKKSKEIERPQPSVRGLFVTHSKLYKSTLKNNKNPLFLDGREHLAVHRINLYVEKSKWIYIVRPY